MRIVDTHQHLWDLQQFSYAWTAGHAVLNRNFLLADYAAATRGYDIAKTVFLECDVDEPDQLGEARNVLRLSELPDNPVSGVVAGCRPESPDFPAYLAQLAGHPNLKGLRRILHVVADDVSLSPYFIPNLKLLPQHNLSFDLCFFARQLPLALRLIAACPDVQFILDHCGNPDIASGDLGAWRGYIKEIAQAPNVTGKISGIVVNAKPHWTMDDLRPSVEHMIDSFGWERVMFGSDWPVCTQAASLSRWIDTLTEITRFAGEANQQKLFGDNAERLYRLA
jgi:predicted TIM-barrel fold metal-dependent hydrolase